MKPANRYEDVEFLVEAELERLERAQVESKQAHGSVDGLGEEELADGAELVRWVEEGRWPWWFKYLKKDRDGEGPRPDET